jgi:hypothetical protein
MAYQAHRFLILNLILFQQQLQVHGFFSNRLWKCDTMNSVVQYRVHWGEYNNRSMCDCGKPYKILNWHLTTFLKFGKTLNTQSRTSSFLLHFTRESVVQEKSFVVKMLESKVFVSIGVPRLHWFYCISFFE